MFDFNSAKERIAQERGIAVKDIEPWMLGCDGEYQHAVSNFVAREVLLCVSPLIYEFSKIPELADKTAELWCRYPDHSGEISALEEKLEVAEREYTDTEHEGFGYEERADEGDATAAALLEAAQEDLRLIQIDIDDINEKIEELKADDEPIEAYEHWVVSGWLADKLRARGEIIEDDFYGLTVWGRCTTGQAIFLDDVICDIFNELQGV